MKKTILKSIFSLLFVSSTVLSYGQVSKNIGQEAEQVKAKSTEQVQKVKTEGTEKVQEMKSTTNSKVESVKANAEEMKNEAQSDVNTEMDKSDLKNNLEGKAKDAAALNESVANGDAKIKAAEEKIAAALKKLNMDKAAGKISAAEFSAKKEKIDKATESLNNLKAKVADAKNKM